MAVLAELLRGRGEQQDAGNDLRQLLDQRVFGADLVLVPDQVVGFVDHQQVPAGGEQGVLGAFVFLQPLQGDQGQLGVLEGIAGIAFGEALLSNRATCRLKRRRISTNHWCWRFSGTRISTRPARPESNWRWMIRPASMVLLQAHFVGQQDARRHAVGDFAGDVQLVGDRLGAGAAEAPERGLEQLAAAFESVVAQGEPGQGIDLSGEQTVAGEAELDEVGELGFRQGALLVLRAVRPWYTNRPSLSSTSRTVIFQPSKCVTSSPGRSARGSAAHCARRIGGYRRSPDRAR